MSAEAAGVLLVFSSLPDEAAAQKLARHLVDAKLAACVNVLSPCISTYRWRGAVEEAREVPVIIKTTAAGYPALEDAGDSVAVKLFDTEAAALESHRQIRSARAGIPRPADGR